MHELMALGRFADAEKVLRQRIAEEPEDAVAHAYLAHCLLALERRHEALPAAQRAVALAPDLSFAHAMLSRVLLQFDRRKEAREAGLEALRLDPDTPANYSQLAVLALDDRDFEGAIRYAELGLDLDPENEICQSVRGLALARLKRSDEALDTMDSALALDPESALAHTSRGWVQAQQGDLAGAQASFREALRLEPDNDWAREGLTETIRARHAFYRWVFQWRLWMATLSRGKAWLFLIAFVIGRRILAELAREFPVLEPFVTPVLILYFLAVILTWFASPIANLLLRLHPLGRFILAKEDRQASDLFGILLALGVAAGLMAFVTNSGRALVAALVFVLLGLISSGLVANHRLRESSWIRLYGVGMAALGVAAIVIPLPQIIGLFGLGFVAFIWINNFYALK